MAILGATDLGDGLLALSIDHDPESVATDAPKGSLLYETGAADWWKKDDDGATTNVTLIQAGPFVDSSPITKGNVDATKLFRIENDTNIPTTTTVVMTAPATDFEPDDKTTPRPPNTETTATVTTTDATLTTIATIPLADNTVYLILARVVGRRTDAADRFGGRREAVVFREAAGSATRQGQDGTPFTRRSSGSYRAEINVSGNNAIIQVRGASLHTINWKVIFTATNVA